MNYIQQNKQSQSGRSMVEMLGVLAIIGVLSVGGIAGYRYAMAENSANNFLDNLSKFTVLVRSTQETSSSPYGEKKLKINNEEISYDAFGCYFGCYGGFLYNYSSDGNWINVCKAIARKISPKVFEPLVGAPGINQFGFYLEMFTQEPWFSYDGKTLIEEATLEERVSACESIDNEHGSGHAFLFDVYDQNLCD